MPQAKTEKEYTPIKGAVYEVLVTKLGGDDGWVLGDQIVAEDFPDVNLTRLEANGSVRRVDGGATTPTAPATPAPLTTTLPPIAPSSPSTATKP